MSTPALETTLTSRDEMLVALNELLEAERAGARVAMETARDMPPCALSTLMQDVHKDEVRWCSMLMRTIKALEARRPAQRVRSGARPWRFPISSSA